LILIPDALPKNTKSRFDWPNTLYYLLCRCTLIRLRSFLAVTTGTWATSAAQLWLQDIGFATSTWL